MAFLLSVLVATLATASPVTQFVTKQALPGVPEGWQRLSAAPVDQQMDLHIRLKEQNMDQLQQRLLEVSNPEHADYGKHMTKAEVDALTAPTQETVDSVTKWLSSHGIDAGKVSSGFLTVSVSVDQAQKMLNTDYGVYKHESTGRETVRTTGYSVPRDIEGAIAMIQPTTLFTDLGMSNKKMLSGAGIDTRAAEAADATDYCRNEGSSTKCLRQNYNVPLDYKPSGKTTLGICGFLGEVPSPDDLASYIKKYDSNLPTNISNVEVVSINNGPTSPGGEGEADLDVQIAVPLTYPIHTTFFSTGGTPPQVGDAGNEPYLDWLKYTLDLDSPAQTYSISYGDDEPTVPSDYADAVCESFMKLGARGVTILTAAGDSGAGGRSACDGSGNIEKFKPSFPAACPWVTVVGGTTSYGSDEHVFRDGGCGFSNHFSTPDYQADAVKGYIGKLNGKLDGAYNASGRAYPDVTALYTNFPIYQGGFPGRSGGTSASTPTTASIIALLNDFLVASGKKPLGFLNPFLYTKGHAGFRDIAKGATGVCGDKTAFPATEGWDAASGWGVPDFGKLKALLQ